MVVPKSNEEDKKNERIKRPSEDFRDLKLGIKNSWACEESMTIIKTCIGDRSSIKTPH